MEWSDEGIVIGVRPHGETAAVVELFTRAHGRHNGLVHGGRSRKARPILQIGNHVTATWKARLSEQLGHIAVELNRGYAAAAMDDPDALAALSSMCTLTRLLPDRDPHPDLFEITLFVLSYFDDAALWPTLYVRWEMALLDELGAGLDLASCAATARTDDLIYVSPKSGRAVSREAGSPYSERLLVLPPFLQAIRPTGANARVLPEDIAAGLRLTGYFLETRVLAPREMTLPEARGRLLRQSER